MNLRIKRNELKKEAILLQTAYLTCDGKNRHKNYEKSTKLQQKQNEVYKKWKFYDEFLKAKEK